MISSRQFLTAWIATVVVLLTLVYQASAAESPKCNGESSDRHNLLDQVNNRDQIQLQKWIIQLSNLAKAEGISIDYVLSKYLDQATKKNVFRTFLLNEISRLLIEEAYCRSHQMVRASHLQLPEQQRHLGPSLRQLIMSGKLEFADAVKLYSNDKLTRKVGGDLGYFTVFEQFYPLETAAYATAIGNISPLFQSRFGYHLIMPTEKIPTRSRNIVAQIMIRGHSTESEQKIKHIYKLTTLTDFKELVKSYSEDLISRANQGALGDNRLLDVLEAVRLRLRLNEISKPVKSPAGWHILKVVDEIPVPGFNQLKPRLSQSIDRDRRPERIVLALEQRNINYPVVSQLLDWYPVFIHASYYLAQRLSITPPTTPKNLLGQIKSQRDRMLALGLELN